MSPEMSPENNVKDLRHGYKHEPTKEGLCRYATGTWSSGPRACEKFAKWLVEGVPLCGIHYRSAQRRQCVVYVTEGSDR